MCGTKAIGHFFEKFPSPIRSGIRILVQNPT
jgi:hypothetical protein